MNTYLVLVVLVLFLVWWNRNTDIKVVHQNGKKTSNDFFDVATLRAEARPKYFTPKDTVINFNCLPGRIDNDNIHNRCPIRSEFLQNANDIFDPETRLHNFEAYGSPVEKSCLQKAKQVCQIRSLPSDRCFNHQYRHNALQQFPRSGELVGTYVQEPNNQMAYTKCDCSNRTFDMCPIGEKVSEACVANAMATCMSGK